MIEERRDKHSHHSSIREEYVEYIFLAELCSYAWRTDQFIGIARPATDAFGYDVILTRKGQARHVQLKATVEGGKASYQTINVNLADAPSGCVIWLFIDRDSLKPTKFAWFGNRSGEQLPPLGDEVGKHTKGDADGNKGFRPSTRKVLKPRFDWLENIEQVFNRLFDA